MSIHLPAINLQEREKTVLLVNVIGMLLIHEMMLYALADALCTLHFNKLMALNNDCDILLKIRIKKGEKLKISRKNRINCIDGYTAPQNQ